MAAETKAAPTEQKQELETLLRETIVNNNPTPFIERYLIIRDEGDAFVPLHWNRVQTHYNANAGLRNIIVKPRKIGFTTRWLAVNFTKAITTPGFQALGLTYDDAEAQYMFDIVRRFYDMLPKWAQPLLGTDKTTAMSFPNLDSSIEIQTAGGRRKGRGRTPSAVLLDEYAQYDENTAVEIFSSIINSAPLWSEVTIQSTPKGIGNEFHRQFVRAESGESAFKAFFYPWMWLDEKHRIAPDDFLVQGMPALSGSLTYADDEMLLLDSWKRGHLDHPIGQDHIRWRRYKAAEDTHTFRQEYPEDSVSCFLATTDTVFDSELLIPLLQRAQKPMDVTLQGALKVLRRPQPGQAYCVGVDCGEGIPGRDNSAAIIGTASGTVAAVLCGIFDQIDMAQMVFDLGMKYNEAFVLGERQGAFTFLRELHNMGYKNIYRHQEERRAGGHPSEAPLGFPTTTASKRQLIDGMRNALKGDVFQCFDVYTLREMSEYKRHKDGTYGAPVGVDSHDDRAMAAMLYVHALTQHSRASPAMKRTVANRSVVQQYREEVWA